MSTVTSRAVVAPRFPLRVVAVAAFLLIVLIVGAALLAGSQHRLPAPFGPARNGLVTYASNGDIYTVDAVSGRSAVVVNGPGNVDPRWSRDGTHLVFERQDVVSGRGLVYVARADGSDPTQVTPDSLAGITTYSFSPDGKDVLIAATANGVPAVFIAAADGSGIRRLDLPGRVTDAAWRPPDGSEILFMDDGADSSGTDSGIYAVNVRDGKVRTILKAADAEGRFRGHPLWSPDGSRISFGEWMGVGPDLETHVITADGTGDRVLPIPSNGVTQAPISLSNDGTRLLVVRGYPGGFDQSRAAIVPVDGSGSGFEIAYPGGFDTGGIFDWEWAPDDASILGTPVDASGSTLHQVLLDLGTGSSRTVPWASVSQPSWQRVVP